MKEIKTNLKQVRNDYFDYWTDQSYRDGLAIGIFIGGLLSCAMILVLS
jgi:hypothetical protein